MNSLPENCISQLSQHLIDSSTNILELPFSMFQRLYTRMFFIAVCVTASCSSALAIDTQPVTPAEKEKLQYPSLAMMPAKSRHFLQLGLNTKLSAQEIGTLLNTFERDLSEIYSQLGSVVSPLEKKTVLTDAESAMLTTSLRLAGARIITATQTALKPVGLSEAELSQLLPTFYYFSTETKLSIRKEYPDTNKDTRAEVIMPQPLPLLYFFAGFSRRADVYIDIKPDKRVIGNSFIVNFPAYYISRSGKEELAGMPDDLSRFLENPAFEDVVPTLYDLSIQKFQIVRLGKSAAYTLNGAEGNYDTYGMIDLLDGQDRIFLYEDNIRHRTRRLGEKWRQYLQNSVEIHELMHALRRTRQPVCADDIDKRVVALNLEEAQAEAASLAVLASERHQSLNYVLYIKRRTGWSNPPHLIYDDFYRGILTVVLQRRFITLRARAASSSSFATSDIPKFFQLISSSVDSAKSTTPGSISLGALKIGRKDAGIIIADIDRLEAADRMELLFDVTPEDVLDEAHEALVRVVQLEKRLCQ